MGRLVDTTEGIGADRLDALVSSFAAVPLAVIATDMTGSVTHWNAHASELYGWSTEEAIGAPIQSLTIGPTTDVVAQRIMTQVLAGRTWEGEFAALCRDGRTVDVHVLDVPVLDADGTIVGIMGISFDVTSERDDLEAETEAVRELAAASTEVREAERARIARDLHDELGQYLTMVRTELHGVRETGIDRPRDLSEAIERLLRMTDASLDQLHRIVEDLGPRDLGTRGLDVALSQLLDGFAARTGQSTVARIDAPMVSERTARALFRIAQGCLTNIERHARARRVHVDCHRVDDPTTGRTIVRMTVRDDGIGIGQGADGFGLTAMHTRASELGGSLDVARHPDGGTIVTVELPLGSKDSP